MFPEAHTDEAKGAQPQTAITVSERVQHPAKKQTRTLDLKNCRLSSLPAGLSELNHVTTLDLSNNRLTSLDAHKLPPNLRLLILDGNPFRAFPASLKTLMQTKRDLQVHFQRTPAPEEDFGRTLNWALRNNLPAPLYGVGATSLGARYSPTSPAPARPSPRPRTTAVQEPAARSEGWPHSPREAEIPLDPMPPHRMPPSLLQTRTGAGRLQTPSSTAPIHPPRPSTTRDVVTSSRPPETEIDAVLALHSDYPTLSDELKAWVNTFPVEARWLAAGTAANIHNCLKNEGDVLHLSNSGIVDLPSALWKNTALTQLYLDGNNLTRLPQEIGKLENLTHLGLSGNQISELPKEIQNLKNLRVLTLDGNELTKLPKEGFRADQLVPFLESLPEGCTVTLGKSLSTTGNTEHIKGQKGAQAVIVI
jgi:hypothetical protein